MQLRLRDVAADKYCKNMLVYETLILVVLFELRG